MRRRTKRSAARIPSEIKAYDINPVARERIRDGGVLRWGINEYPANWNLNHVDGNLATVKRITDGLMPSPFRSDEKGKISANTDYLLAGRLTESRPDRSSRWPSTQRPGGPTARRSPGRTTEPSGRR
ncbi:hypothetical protein ACFQX6_59655 [Streptosporangium lutulentum]